MHLDDDTDNLVRYLEEGIAAGELSPDIPVEPIARDIVFSMYGASVYRCSAYTAFGLAAWSENFIRNALMLHIDPYRLKGDHQPSTPARCMAPITFCFRSGNCFSRPAIRSAVSCRAVTPSAGQPLLTTGSPSLFTARRMSASAQNASGRIRYRSLRER